MIDAGYGPVLRMVFEFSDAKKFIGGNHRHGETTRVVRGKRRSVKYVKPEAKAQDKYFATVACQAVLAANWEIPAYCRMDVLGINIDADRANMLKTVEDPLQGICIPNDRYVNDGNTSRMRDKGPSRIVVAIQAIDGKAFGFPRPSKKRSPHV